MKFLFIFFLFFTNLFSLTLVLNSAKENNEPYGVLHLIDKQEIKCKTNSLEFDKKEYVCEFEGQLDEKLKEKNTPLLQIEFSKKDNGFFIIIRPKLNSKIINTNFDLYGDTEAPIFKSNNSKHLSIVVFKDLKFIRNEKYDGVDFPITYPNLKKPSVGALDLNGNPIEYIESLDLDLFLETKKMYENEVCDRVLDNIKLAKRKFPNSVFNSEFALYELRCIDKKLNDNEEELPPNSDIDHANIINSAKAWIRNFPSDNHISEILQLMTRAYLKSGARDDAEYTLDVLITEHKESMYTKLAIIDYADFLLLHGNWAEAQKLYEQVLYSAKNLDVASKAAMSLASLNLSKGRAKNAEEYFLKILNANKNFILKKKKSTYELSKNIADSNLTLIAAKMAEIVLNDSTKASLYYEPLLKDVGLWYEKIKDVPKAYKYLNKYKQEYKNGIFIDEIEEGLDRLFFEINDKNSTEKYAYYEELMKKYDNKISSRALIEKANLFLEEKKYDEVLALDEKLQNLKDYNSTRAYDILKQAAFFRAQKAIQENDCSKAISLIEKYKVSNQITNRHRLFECYLRLSRNQEAVDEAKTHIYDEDLEERLEWIMKFSRALCKNAQYNESIQAADDAIKLSQGLEYSDSSEVLYNKFNSYFNLKKIDKAMQTADKIEEERMGEFINSEIYKKLVDWGLKTSNDLIVKKYASKIIYLENEAKDYTFSPDIDFVYATSLSRLNENKEALGVIENVLKRDLNESKKSRALYLASEFSIKDGNKTSSKKYLEECSKLDVNDSWQKLCKESLSIFE